MEIAGQIRVQGVDDDVPAVATVAMGVGANDDRGELSSVGGC
jgi:hypothetical protein